MPPAFSVIVFTVSSGAGLGLLALAVLVLPVALTWLGLACQLADPSQAGVAALALTTAVLALAIVLSTAMIYACLRTIRQWNTSLVPANFLLMALASGGVLLMAVQSFSGGDAGDFVGTATLVLLLSAGVGKVVYCFWIDRPQGSTINTATGFTRGEVQLFESGQSSSAYLNKEFGFEARPAIVRAMRWAVYGLGFGLPVALVGLSLGRPEMASALVLPIAASLLAGLAIERWLFFAEARHVVNLFYGLQRT